MECSTCYNCSKVWDGVKLKKCSGCFVNRYCSIECQEKDWSAHKEFCQIEQAKMLFRLLNLQFLTLPPRFRDKVRELKNKCALKVEMPVIFFDTIADLKVYVYSFNEKSLEKRVSNIPMKDLTEEARRLIIGATLMVMIEDCNTYGLITI